MIRIDINTCESLRDIAKERQHYTAVVRGCQNVRDWEGEPQDAFQHFIGVVGEYAFNRRYGVLNPWPVVEEYYEVSQGHNQPNTHVNTFLRTYTTCIKTGQLLYKPKRWSDDLLYVLQIISCFDQDSNELKNYSGTHNSRLFHRFNSDDWGDLDHLVVNPRGALWGREMRKVAQRAPKKRWNDEMKAYPFSQKELTPIENYDCFWAGMER